MEASRVAISRRVSLLEDALGVRLLNRPLPRRLELTVAGQHFWSGRMLNRSWKRWNRQKNNREMLTDVIKMAAPMTFGVKKLTLMSSEFLDRYPHIMLLLKLEDRLTGIVGDGFDISLRISELCDSSLVSNTIAVSRRVLHFACVY